MIDNETNPNNSGRKEQKPALVLLRDGNVLDVAHQFTNTDDQLCVFLEAREGGIDAKINLDDVVAVVKTRDAARALNGEDEYTSDELVADGGRDARDVFERRMADLRALKEAGATCALPSCDNKMDKHDLGLLFCSPYCGSLHRDRSGKRGKLTEESIGVPVDGCDELSGGYIGN